MRGHRGSQLCISRRLGSEGTGDHHGPLRQGGDLLLEKGTHPDIFDADRVQHARGRLSDPRRRIPRTRLERQALADEAANRFEIQERCKLGPVAEGPGRGQHRIAQRDPGEIHALVDRRAHGSPSQFTSEASKTGP